MSPFAGNALRTVDTRPTPAISSFRKDSLISQGMTGLTWKSLITFRDHSFQLCALN